MKRHLIIWIAFCILFCTNTYAPVVDGISAWTFSPVPNQPPGEEFTIDLIVDNVTDLAGWQLNLLFSPEVLEVIQVKEGDFLKQRDANLTFWQPGEIDNATGKVQGISSVVLGNAPVTGIGTILTITFKAKQVGEGIVGLEDLRPGNSLGKPIEYETASLKITITDFLPWDVNLDRLIDIFDLILIAQSFGKALSDPTTSLGADVNRDGEIDIFDLILVAQHFGESAAPPKQPDATHRQMIQDWLTEARAVNDGSEGFKLGIAALKRLLLIIVPERTTLYQNYPNPFNPETWIPYGLAVKANVSIIIYNAQGYRIRTLDLGTQPAGAYVVKDKAAYWNGRNETGELVSGGVYFYHLQTGDFSATKKMTILK
jgi:hypothetical protein